MLHDNNIDSLHCRVLSLLQFCTARYKMDRDKVFGLRDYRKVRKQVILVVFWDSKNTKRLGRSPRPRSMSSQRSPYFFDGGTPTLPLTYIGPPLQKNPGLKALIIHVHIMGVVRFLPVDSQETKNTRDTGND